MNQRLVLRVKAGDANWMDPVSLARHGQHPIGSRITAVPGHLAAFDFEWTPSASFGGWSKEVCFRASDSGGLPTVLCLVVSVRRCLWHASQGQSLASIAALFGTNYVQLWTLNPERSSPDDYVKSGDKIAVGHMYQVRATDNMRYLAVQFATTRGTIEMLNFDLVEANEVHNVTGDKDGLVHWAGKDVCILPHSCVGQ